MSTDLPDFDTLMAMAQKDPAAFEQYRAQMLQNCINEAPPEHRPAMQHLVFRMNQVRENADTPLDAAAGAAALMKESAAQLESAMDHLQHATAGVQAEQVLKKFQR